MNHQKEKAKIRATPEWKNLKENVRNSQGGLDALTGKPVPPPNPSASEMDRGFVPIPTEEPPKERKSMFPMR